jgi:hypothetical protein
MEYYGSIDWWLLSYTEYYGSIDWWLLSYTEYTCTMAVLTGGY